jgi:hypothetical protein
MPYISVNYELPLPNEFLIDHSFSQGKTRTTTYHGPDKIYLYIGEDGLEKHGPVTAEDLADGRPCPADSQLFEVDCTEHPLICQLRGPIINDLQETRDPTDIPHPQSPAIEGYSRFSYQLPLMANDVYDWKTLQVIDGVPVMRPWTLTQKLVDRDEPLTWEDIRQHRDRMLAGSDSAIAEDMPESMKNSWKEYRQKLRDFPAVMQEHNVPPMIAYYMFPNTPNS